MPALPPIRRCGTQARASDGIILTRPGPDLRFPTGRHADGRKGGGQGSPSFYRPACLIDGIFRRERSQPRLPARPGLRRLSMRGVLIVTVGLLGLSVVGCNERTPPV